MKTLTEVKGRVSAVEVAEMEGNYLVYWGAPSAKEEHRVAVLHRVRDNGMPVCHYTSGAQLITLPDGMREGIRWYKACRACQAAA